MTLRRVFPLLMLFLAGCSGCPGCNTVSTQPTEAPIPGTSTTNGLEGQERTRFHHLAEGSELYPLSWLKALTTRDTDKPFLDNAERFGFLPDADQGDENPSGLPVGMTAAESRDLRFAKVQMVGVNCAACHVNDLYYKGQRVVRLDGAPNLLDISLFYSELAKDTQATFMDPLKAWNFAMRLYGVYNPSERALLLNARVPDPKAVEGIGGFSALKEGGDLERALADRITALHQKELEQPIDPLYKGLKPSPSDQDLHDYLKSTAHKPGVTPAAIPKEIATKLLTIRTNAINAIKTGDLKPLATKEPAQSSSLFQLSAAERETAISGALEHFVETIRLLRRRAAFLLQLAGQQSDKSTTALFGRVDAFGEARNFIFDQSLPLTAPISYPHIWNLKQIAWFHWDANTTSLLERNVGQALGLGAIFDPDTGESTVLVKNIEELEGLAGKITPPVWPQKEFGPIDPAKRAKGEALYATHCLSCHKLLKAGDTMGDDRVDLDKIGTDPARALNFGRQVNGQDFDVALSAALKKVTTAGGGTVKPEKEWRVTKQYASRPLVAPWATAPYLHNNSVPTLYHLLKPVKDRPSTFPVGHREYDPVRLGYTTENAGPPSVTFDTTKPGNSNAGHEYPPKGLDENEIMALLEYLKSLK